MLVILLPGLEGTGDLFDSFIEKTPDGFQTRVISYPPRQILDYSGYVAYVREKLPRNEPFLLLGESFSGPVSILAAAESPPGLRGLILCNTFAVRPAWRILRVLPWRLAFSFPIPKYKIGFYLVGRENTGAWADRIRAANRKTPPRVLAHRIRSVFSVDVRDSLASLQIPVLYLRGTRDRLVWDSSLRRILETKPDVHVARIGAPHLVLQIAPDECWSALSTFCATNCV